MNKQIISGARTVFNFSAFQGNHLADACGVAKVVRDDHGGVQRLEV